MTHSPFLSEPRPPRFHRIEGPLGGVTAGLASTFGVSANLLRVALAALALFFGLTVMVIYLALWFVLPEAPGIPAERSPGRPPMTLVVLVGLLYAAGFLFHLTLGLLSLATSLVPLALLVLAVVALVALWRRSTGQSQAA